MTFRTELHFPPALFQLDHPSSVVLQGSCFAENISTLLQRYHFQCKGLSHGILFNPISIAQALRDVIEKKEYVLDDLTETNGNYVSLHHHGRFNDPNGDECLKKINSCIAEANNQLKHSKVLIITFGSAWAWRHLKTNQIVANCHKIPQAAFHKELIQSEAVIAEFKSLLESLLAFNPSLQIVFTISPVRYLRDGLVANNISKSHLLIAAHELVRQHERFHYFPAYELVVDDLRDYRFFKEDMLHPSDQAVRYVWQKFSSWCFSESALAKMKTMEKYLLVLEHIPIHSHPDSQESISEAKRAIQQILES